MEELMQEQLDPYQPGYSQHPDYTEDPSQQRPLPPLGPPPSAPSWPVSEVSIAPGRETARTTITQWPGPEQQHIAPARNSARSSIAQWPVPEQEPLLERKGSISTERTLAQEQAGNPHVLEANKYEQMVPVMTDQRKQPELPRGIITRAPAHTEDQLVDAIETKLRYRFRNRDLILEALENPGSGIVCVGRGKRLTLNGNQELSNLGRSVMEMRLMQQFYEIQLPESEYARMSVLIGRENLSRIGEDSGIQRWIHPKRPLPPSHESSVLRLLMDDMRAVKGDKDPKRIIARAMRALIGAVYLDGGIMAAGNVMTELRLLIRREQNAGQHDSEKQLY